MLARPQAKLERSRQAVWIPVLRRSNSSRPLGPPQVCPRSEEHTSELQSHVNLVCRLLLEKKKLNKRTQSYFCKSNLFPPYAFPVFFLRIGIPPISLFFTYTAPTEIYTLSLHDALPSSPPVCP